MKEWRVEKANSGFASNQEGYEIIDHEEKRLCFDSADGADGLFEAITHCHNSSVSSLEKRIAELEGALRRSRGVIDVLLSHICDGHYIFSDLSPSLEKRLIDEVLRDETPIASTRGDVRDTELPNPESVNLIASERKRQIEEEGWTPSHDDTHNSGEMVRAALCYADIAQKQVASRLFRQTEVLTKSEMQYIRGRWPWDFSWWKWSLDPVRNLVKAGALICAEIDRLQRQSHSVGRGSDSGDASVIQEKATAIATEWFQGGTSRTYKTISEAEKALADICKHTASSKPNEESLLREVERAETSALLEKTRAAEQSLLRQELLREVERLRGALEKHGRHHAQCSRVLPQRICNCGLQKELDATPPAPPDVDQQEKKEALAGEKETDVNAGHPRPTECVNPESVGYSVHRGDCPYEHGGACTCHQDVYQVTNQLNLEITLMGCAALLDTIKREWGPEWSTYDQSVRDSITTHLKAHAIGPTEGADPELVLKIRGVCDELFDNLIARTSVTTYQCELIDEARVAIEVLMGRKKCEVCYGKGWYAYGETDAPEQRQCDSCCYGTGLTQPSSVPDAPSSDNALF